MEGLINKILEYGLLPTFLLVVIFLIIQDPERAVKLKSIIFEPFFRFKRWFSKEYISSKISSSVNEFFKRNIYSLLTDVNKYNFKIKWVSKINDPILKEDGTLILRLKEEQDQTKNILSAVQVALPNVVCPLIRENISTTCTKSIDLAILQKLSFKLGQHGKSTFKKYFLLPETKDDEKIGELVRDLIHLDKRGFFVPIFLNELTLIGEGIYADNDNSDYTAETIAFLNYLLTIVNREIGAEIELNYLKTPFNVGTILLAKAERANTQGLRPYLGRLRKKLDKGCESVYIVSFPPAFPFFEKLMSTLDSHERVFIKNVFNTNEYEPENPIKQNKLRIALLRKNDIYVDETFQSKIEANDIFIGKKVEGIVEHVSKQETLVNVLGMRAYINKKDCSWLTIKDCGDVLDNDEEYDFIIKSVDKVTSTIHLSRKFNEENPWNLDELPKLNELIEIEVVSFDAVKFTCLYKEKLEIYILDSEMSWFLLSESSKEKFIGTFQKVKVIEVNEDEQKIFCSLKQMEEDPWPVIHQSLKKGTEMTSKVIEVNSDYVYVELPNNYKGRIPRDFLKKAGYEYKNYQENIVVGQGIEVVVSKVFIKRQWIRLDLKRNQN